MDTPNFSSGNSSSRKLKSDSDENSQEGNDADEESPDNYLPDSHLDKTGLRKVRNNSSIRNLLAPIKKALTKETSEDSQFREFTFTNVGILKDANNSAKGN